MTVVSFECVPAQPDKRGSLLEVKHLVEVEGSGRGELSSTLSRALGGSSSGLSGSGGTEGSH
jgi:hypothetical protein